MIVTKRKGQSFIYRSKWADLKESIREKWADDYYITDFDYGTACIEYYFQVALVMTVIARQGVPLKK